MWMSRTDIHEEDKAITVYFYSSGADKEETGRLWSIQLGDAIGNYTIAVFIIYYEA